MENKNIKQSKPKRSKQSPHVAIRLTKLKAELVPEQLEHIKAQLPSIIEKFNAILEEHNIQDVEVGSLALFRKRCPSGMKCRWDPIPGGLKCTCVPI